MNLNTVKSNLSDIAASTLESLSHGQEVLSDTSKSVGKDVSRSASKLMHSKPVNTVSKQLSTLGKVVVAATSAKALSSALNPEVPMQWMLGALNLQRRPSTFARIATGIGLIAAGAAVGAGVAMLLSPKTGEENREMLRRSIQSLKRNAQDVAEQVETKAHDVAQNVETKTHNVIVEARDIASDEISKATGGAGTTGTKPRIPGLSHRSPKL